LIVFTVRSYRPSAAYNAMLQANYGYSGGAMAVAAVKTARGADARKMLDGEVLMYYLPVRLEPTELIVALPSNGADAPRQRWVRR
jgi:hypothetical protein